MAAGSPAEYISHHIQNLTYGEHADGSQDMGGIGALTSSRFQYPNLFEPMQQEIQYLAFNTALDQARTKIAKQRIIKPSVR